MEENNDDKFKLKYRCFQLNPLKINNMESKYTFYCWEN